MPEPQPKRAWGLSALLCYAVPVVTGAVTATLLLGLPHPPPTAPTLRAALLAAMLLNVALAFAGPAWGGVLKGGTLRRRLGRALAYGVGGTGGHWAVFFAVALAQRLLRGDRP